MPLAVAEGVEHLGRFRPAGKLYGHLIPGGRVEQPHRLHHIFHCHQIPHVICGHNQLVGAFGLYKRVACLWIIWTEFRFQKRVAMFLAEVKPMSDHRQMLFGQRAQHHGILHYSENGRQHMAGRLLWGVCHVPFKHV